MMSWVLLALIIAIVVWPKKVVAVVVGVAGAFHNAAERVRAARAPALQPMIGIEAAASPPPPAKPLLPQIDWGKIGRVVLNLLGALTNPRFLALLAVLVIILIIARGCDRLTGPFGDWFVSRDEAIEQRNDAREDAAVNAHERDVAADANRLQERTHRNTEAARAAVAQGQQDIDNALANLPPAVSASDFAELQRVYAAAYLSVLRIDPPSADRPDPTPGRTNPVRRSRAYSA